MILNDLPDNLIAKLDELREQHAELSDQLVDPDVLADHRRVRAISIKRAALEPIVSDYGSWRDALGQIEELQQVIEEDGDAELVALAREELPELRETAKGLAQSIQTRLVTADDQAVGAVILEVRAGVGGDEAGIWAGDLLEMYRRAAADHGWKVEEIALAPAEQGGFKSAIVSITGEGVWAFLGYEGGTHQVKRVPATEAQGRIHTSTATVAVLPEPEAVEVEIDPNDVKEMITTSQGPGGQNVNKVETAVELRFEAARSPNLTDAVKGRLRRLAGRRWTKDGAVVIRAEAERSQARNRAEALERLIDLIARAAVAPKRRIRTRPTLGSKRRRLAAKARRGEVKVLRGKVEE